MVTFVIGIIALLIAIPAIIFAIRMKVPELVETGKDAWGDPKTNENDVRNARANKRFATIVASAFLLLQSSLVQYLVSTLRILVR